MTKLILIFEFEIPDEDLDDVQHTIEIVRDEVKGRTNQALQRKAYIAVNDMAERVLAVVNGEVFEGDRDD